MAYKTYETTPNTNILRLSFSSTPNKLPEYDLLEQLCTTPGRVSGQNMTNPKLGEILEHVLYLKIYNKIHPYFVFFCIFTVPVSCTFISGKKAE